MRKSLARCALIWLAGRGRGAASGALVGCALIPVAHALALPAPASAAGKPNRMVFRAFVVEGRHWEGPIQGPWEWSGDVTVRASGMVMGCDRLKLWLPKGMGNPERVVATGNIRIDGRFRDAKSAEWEVHGRGESATYEKQSATLVLQGSVTFKATNLTAGGVLPIEAEKLTYDIGKQTFRLDQGDERVRVEWQGPEPQKQAGSAPAEEPSEEPGGG